MNNRIIKFQIYDSQEKKMIDPSLVTVGTNTAGEQIITIGGYFVAPSMLGYNERYYVREYTGLLDKNGKEIFEGDIVRYNTKGNFMKDYEEGIESLRSIGPVVFDEYCFSLVDGEGTRYPLYWIDFGIEVVGNIYESPELLKKDTTK